MKPHELQSRWTSDDGRQLADEVFARLERGAPLTDLGLAEIDGRLDLRGLLAPPIQRQLVGVTDRFFIHELSWILSLEDTTLTALDLSHARLPELRLMHCRIHNCIFDRAHLRGWRFWATDILESSVQRARIEWAFAGWDDGRGNLARQVDFTRSDLRGSYFSARFEDCTFDFVNARRVNFGASEFIRCRFAGELYDVQFWGRDWGRNVKPTPARMEDVDMADAIMRYVAFYGVDLSHVCLPHNDQHFIVRHLPCVMERAVAELADRQDRLGRGLRGLFKAGLNAARKYGQRTDVYHRLDLAEPGIDDTGAEGWALLERLEAECAALERP